MKKRIRIFNKIISKPQIVYSTNIRLKSVLNELFIKQIKLSA